jgi:hypothetical protein
LRHSRLQSGLYLVTYMMRGIGSEIVWSVAVNFLFKTLILDLDKSRGSKVRLDDPFVVIRRAHQGNWIAANDATDYSNGQARRDRRTMCRVTARGCR